RMTQFLARPSSWREGSRDRSCLHLSDCIAEGARRAKLAFEYMTALPVACADLMGRDGRFYDRILSRDLRFKLGDTGFEGCDDHSAASRAIAMWLQFAATMASA